MGRSVLEDTAHPRCPVTLLTLSLSLSLAYAESWCASPLLVHEWGVATFRGEGEPTPGPSIPASYHRSLNGEMAPDTDVRSLPADSGNRALPVVHFYSPGGWGDTIPVAFDVAFTHGHAAAWFPQVNALRAAPHANGLAALARYRGLVAARAERQPFTEHPKLPGDPRAQLAWHGLTLTATARSPPPDPGDVEWVGQLRDVDALWVNHGAESERYLFYEGETAERPALSLSRGDSWTPDTPHYVLQNTSSWPVHDVMVVHNGAGGRAVFAAPSIPPGATAGFLLTASVDPTPARSLRARLVDADAPAPPPEWRWSQEDCVMMRDPVIPVDSAEGHRLFAAEVDALLGVWATRIFDQPETTIIYREDTDALDAAMPISVYTDMFHFVQLRRLGLVLWEDVSLP